eukprot:CAMPEP_0117652194 /NCGR_PEP_ID=MMETSP0804-20121206/2496_1 /TAXON_ID=1074897 /ORGANISM="Tetraselmis astigmatica, Strain CCMP880" /LENGTH=224 /DNA_ID=CAMNT_0005458223 /DNA_START=93 /DNA_END=764 /DNA_ORIENTATION=+
MASSVGQNFNPAGIGFFMGLAGGSNRRLVVPHVCVPDIRWVNWKAIRAAGFQGVVFDKDNTLTYPYALKVHHPLQASLRECTESFNGAVALYSNSAGLYEFDPDGKEAEAIEAALGIPVLRHHEKKPSGGAEDMEKHFGCQSSRLVMVGDRYLTDVAFGAKNGMLTVRCAPLTSVGEPSTVWMARKLEEILLAQFSSWGTEPPAHELLSSPTATEGFINDPGIW